MTSTTLERPAPNGKPPIPGVRARKPTGAVPYPLILVEGEEKSGKSWAAALLSASSRVGQTYWLDLGEGGADEYGAIPGARYLVLEHDGTWAQIVARVQEVKAEAARAKDAGKPPVVLVVDTMTDVWEGLKDWASDRAKQQAAKKGRVIDPNGEIKVSMNLWNDAGARYRRLMTQLLTFPGVVILIARGKEVAVLDDKGNPVEGRKEWKVEGHKTLAFDATLWLRMYRTQRPIVVGARSVHVGIRPGADDPKPIEDDHENLLDWIIFDVLHVDPTAAHVRDIKATTGGELTEDEKIAEAEAETIPAARRPEAGPVERQAARSEARQIQANERPPASRPAPQPAAPAPTDGTPEEEPHRIAQRAVRCNDADVLVETFKRAGTEGWLTVDVTADIHVDYLDVVGIEPGRPLNFGTWLLAAGKYIRKSGGLTIHEAAYPEAGTPEEN